MKKCQLYYMLLIDARIKDQPRLVLSLKSKAPGGWSQHHNYWVGDTVEVDVYLWGEPADFRHIEDFCNYQVIFRRGEYEIKD